jgi:glycine cleavage system T protein (aminomethyltransferase)
MCSTNNSAEIDSPQRTALYSLHKSLNAKLVPFAGYALPVQFAEGIKAEHLHTRAHAGLFDVSHMGQIRISGDDAATAFEQLVTGDISGLGDFQQRYTLLTNPEGGIIDDLMVALLPEGLFVVVNGACKQNDFAYIKESLSSTCQIEMLENRALLALQGPKAVNVLDRFDSNISRLGFMNGGQFGLDGIECMINRCGYTGEDGFEISVDNEKAERLAELLLAHDDVKPVGLGARDSLRLEAGLCLYGHDINESTTPVEANLQWAIGKKYRDGSVEASFPGAATILGQVQEGTEKRLVGLRPEGKMPVREGSVILNENKDVVGHVSSGGFGASFAGPVAMGYVSSDYAESGTELQVEIRNRSHTMRVADLPFVEHRYYKP